MYLRKINHKTSKTRTIQFSLHNVQNIIQVWYTTPNSITFRALKWYIRNKIDLLIRKFIPCTTCFSTTNIIGNSILVINLFSIRIAPLISAGISWKYYGKHVLYYDIVSSKFNKDDSLWRIWVIEYYNIKYHEAYIKYLLNPLWYVMFKKLYV